MNEQTKICPLCGKEFIPKPSNRRYCNDKHFRKCIVCGKEFEIPKTYLEKRTCSARCANLAGKSQREQTNMERYGVTNVSYSPEILNKIKKSNEEKYGVSWSFQSEEVKSKISDTLMARYGVDNPMKCAEIQQKAAQTNLEKYGDTTPFGKNSTLKPKIDAANLAKYGTIDPGNRPEGIRKREETNLRRFGARYYKLSEHGKKAVENTCLERYGAKSPFESAIIQEKCKDSLEKRYGVRNMMESQIIKDRLSESVQNKYGVPWACMLPQCIAANGVKNSKINRQFGEMLQCNSIPYQIEFPLERKSFDFLIDGTNILIEINPSYSHTTVDTKFGNVSKEYHIDKSAIAYNHGYRCIHVFDWDDWEKIINLVKPRNKVFARKCKVSTISAEECAKFLNKYHLQGNCKGQSIRYGLYKDDELIQVMTFGLPRYNHKADLELLRLCTKPCIDVVGGAERLMKHAITHSQARSIVSYCDLSKFEGDVYEKLGFKPIKDNLEPSLHWSKGTKQITDNLLRQRGYDQLFGTNFGKGTSNEELMLEHGWLPVYDCGQQTYILSLK